jgi:hypothetical protein
MKNKILYKNIKKKGLNINFSNTNNILYNIKKYINIYFYKREHI